MRIDFHIHSIHSPDSINSMWLINKVCTKRGITPVISDHNRITYAQRYKRKFGNAIVGEEIMTLGGDIICLFATEWIRPKLSIEETIDKIREQGALVYIPHPFDTVRPSAMKEIYFRPDVVEVFNSKNTSNRSNAMALDFAERNNIMKAAGSDAHLPYEIGSSYVEMEEFGSLKEFKRNLAAGRIVGSRTPAIGYPISFAFDRFRRALSLGVRIP